MVRIGAYVGFISEACRGPQNEFPLPQEMDEMWKEVVSQAQTELGASDLQKRIAKGYPGSGIIRRLELGRDWFDVLVNMMTDRESRRLVITLDVEDFWM